MSKIKVNWLTSIARLVTCLFVYGLCSSFVLEQLFDKGSAPKWYSVLWYEHSDHWHAFNIAGHIIDGGLLLSIQSDVYSRLPSFIPDIAVAIVSLVAVSGGFLAMKAYVAIKLCLVFILGLMVIEETSGVSDKSGYMDTSAIIWGLAIIMVCSLNSETLFTFVPIHHGGNVVMTLVGTAIALKKREKYFTWTACLEIVVSFAGTLSNRLFMPSIVIPIIAYYISKRRIMGASRWFCGCILGLSVMGLFRTQGRDSLESLDNDWYLDILGSLTAPALWWAILSVIPLIGFVILALTNKRRVYLEIQDLISLSTMSMGMGVMASYIISSGIQLRYILPGLWLVAISYCVLALKLASGMRLPLVVLCATTLLVANTSNSFLAIATGGFQSLSTEMKETLQLLNSEGLAGKYGLAAYPSWNGSAISWISNNRYRLLESSSDSNPLFWHRWKGSYLTRDRDSGSLSSPYMEQILGFTYILTDKDTSGVLERYGRPDRVRCLRTDTDKCLWRYSKKEEIMDNTRVFIETYGERVKS